MTVRYLLKISVEKDRNQLFGHEYLYTGSSIVLKQGGRKMGNVSCGVLWQRANELFGKPRSQWKTVDEMIYGVDNYFNVPKDRKV